MATRSEAEWSIEEAVSEDTDVEIEFAGSTKERFLIRLKNAISRDAGIVADKLGSRESVTIEKIDKEMHEGEATFLFQVRVKIEEEG